MLLVSLISYVDRSTLAILAPEILKETRLTGEQYGFIVSGFSAAYMLSNPLWGRILDRIGLAAGMAAAVALWSVASTAHAFAYGFGGFALARFVLGLGEGATFPGGLRAVMQTLPATSQGRGIAVAYSGGSLGAVVTPLIVTPVALWWGWRAAFLFTGLLGAAWLALWWPVSRRTDIRAMRARGPAKHVAPHIRHKNFWAFVFAYALGGLPLAFVLYQSALYLGQALGRSQEFIGKVLWIPPLGWEVGYFIWGWLSDRIAAERVTGIRRLLTIAVFLNFPFAFVPALPQLWMVLLEMFFAMFVAAGYVMLAVRYATAIYSAEHAGLIAGIGAGSWSAVVALLMPLFGRLFDQRRYDAAFALAAVVPVLGYLGWLALHRPSRPGSSERRLL